LVIVGSRRLLRACAELPLVFLGLIDRLGRVTMEQTESVEIVSPYPLVYHIDGEPIAGTLTLSAKVRSRALKVRVPAG
jgi:diacylglycerol kinase family enzyme